MNLQPYYAFPNTVRGSSQNILFFVNKGLNLSNFLVLNSVMTNLCGEQTLVNPEPATLDVGKQQKHDLSLECKIY